MPIAASHRRTIHNTIASVPVIKASRGMRYNTTWLIDSFPMYELAVQRYLKKRK